MVRKRTTCLVFLDVSTSTRRRGPAFLAMRKEQSGEGGKGEQVCPARDQLSTGSGGVCDASEPTCVPPATDEMM